jgi:CBS domain-containing protein
MDKLSKREDIEVEVWDHHMIAGGNIKADTLCQESTGATVTLFIREMQKRGMTLNPLDSTVMLIGIYEDTGHLSFSQTTAEDARAVAYLLDNKADLNVANFFLNPPYEENQREILFEMMKDTEKHTIFGQNIGFNTVRLEKKVPNLAEVVNMYRKIINVDALFVIFTGEGSNTVIGRSGVESIHIGRILNGLGGGGHAGAGSATVKAPEMTVEHLKEEILKMLIANRTETAIIADIMSFPVVSVKPDAPMREVQSLMALKRIRGIMVMEDDVIHGIIVLWDLKKIKQDRQWQSPVKAFMSRDVVTIGPGTSPTEAAQLMIARDVGYLPVIQHGKVIGIVTRTDILTYYYDLLPE